MLDTLQIPFFYYLYDTISKHLLLRKLQERTTRKEKRLRKSKFFRWAQLIGMPGVVGVCMTPLKGCGMWSGVLLSELLGLPKKRSYPLLILGSVLGCLLVFGAGEGILELKHFFVDK
jgi:uncharacterized membrane protein